MHNITFIELISIQLTMITNGPTVSVMTCKPGEPGQTDLAVGFRSDLCFTILYV